MKENTPLMGNPKEVDCLDSSRAHKQGNIQAKLEKCDTLLDLLEEDKISEVSSKETTSESTAYPEFGDSSPNAQKISELVSLQIRICTTEISDSSAQALTTGTILACDDSVEQTVELLWQDRVIGRGHLHARDKHYVIEIAELNDLNSQDYSYEI